MDRKTIYADEVDLTYTTEGDRSSFPISIIAKNRDEEVQIFVGKGQAKWLRDGLRILIKAENKLIED